MLLCRNCHLPDHSKVRQNCDPCNESEEKWCGKVKHQPKCPFTDQLITELNEQDIQSIIDKAQSCTCCSKPSFSLVKYGQLKYCRQCAFRLNRKLFFEFNMTPEISEQFPTCRTCEDPLVFKPKGIDQQNWCPMFYNWDFDRTVYRLRKFNLEKKDILQHFEQEGGLQCIRCFDNYSVPTTSFTCYECERVFQSKFIHRKWKSRDVCVECYYDTDIQETIKENSQLYSNSFSRCEFPNCPFCHNEATACQFDHNNMFVFGEYEGCSSPGMSVLFGAPSEFIQSEIAKCTPICHHAHNLTSMVEQKMGYFRAKKAWRKLPDSEKKKEVLGWLEKHYNEHFYHNLTTVLIHLFDISRKPETKKQADRYTAECPDCGLVFQHMKSAHRGCRRNTCPLKIPDAKSIQFEDEIYRLFQGESLVDVIQHQVGYSKAMEVLSEIVPCTKKVIYKRFEWERWMHEHFEFWVEQMEELREKNESILDRHRIVLSCRKRARPED